MGKGTINVSSLQGKHQYYLRFPRKKTQKKYDTPFSPCPNRSYLRSIHTFVARGGGRAGSCVQPVGSAESHRGASAVCARSYGGLRGDLFWRDGPWPRLERATNLHSS